MLRTTVGRVLVNEGLPAELRDYDRVFTKDELNSLLKRVALERPADYPKVAKALSDAGRVAARETGGYSFGLEHISKSKSAATRRDRLQARIDQMLADRRIPPAKLGPAIVKLLGAEMASQQDEILDESLKEDNPLAKLIASGARGNKMNLSSLRGSDMLYADAQGETIPIPVVRSYSEGLSPAEWWAGTYGARQGTLATKLATQRAGFLGKLLNQVNHRLVITQDDDDEQDPESPVGMPADVDDADNAGALLAHPAGRYGRDTVLTPKILGELKAAGVKRVLLRSPVAGGPAQGGLSARQAGVREFGRLPGRGEAVGNTAAQALSNPISQGQLSQKHSGGVAGENKAVTGFDYVSQLTSIPKTFPGSAAHARKDGVVSAVHPAPAGGHHIVVDGTAHYMPPDQQLTVQVGDRVEAGDVLSSGIPNPAEIVAHKGVGEGRRYFASAFRDALKSMNIKGHRRNTEMLARGLIDHVRLTQPHGDYGPEDVVPYSRIAADWEPREGHDVAEPKRLLGRYLEKPVLHYSIGTKIRPSVVRDLEEFGVQRVMAHRDPPPFEYEMIRAQDSLRHDPDFMTRMYGTNLKGGLLDSVHRGLSSDEAGTSFVPSLARGVDFGKVGPFKHAAEAPYAPPPPPPVPEPPEPVEPQQPKPLADPGHEAWAQAARMLSPMGAHHAGLGAAGGYMGAVQKGMQAGRGWFNPHPPAPTWYPGVTMPGAAGAQPAASPAADPATAHQHAVMTDNRAMAAEHGVGVNRTNAESARRVGENALQALPGNMLETGTWSTSVAVPAAVRAAYTGKSWLKPLVQGAGTAFRPRYLLAGETIGNFAGDTLGLLRGDAGQRVSDHLEDMQQMNAVDRAATAWKRPITTIGAGVEGLNQVADAQAAARASTQQAQSLEQQAVAAGSTPTKNYFQTAIEKIQRRNDDNAARQARGLPVVPMAQWRDPVTGQGLTEGELQDGLQWQQRQEDPRAAAKASLRGATLDTAVGHAMANSQLPAVANPQWWAEATRRHMEQERARNNRPGKFE